ncbi:hypothetical protein CRE_31188 [Caenorhabditis remanei]|uniref:Uncharacterized protein n=1 Tax=Caenorhabditis remanei TaxID=31234 RepID=E3MLH4_CAERE|nr:hypothetical protein CRE_31188 [Caenorhabditis remanei]
MRTVRRKKKTMKEVKTQRRRKMRTKLQTNDLDVTVDPELVSKQNSTTNANNDEKNEASKTGSEKSPKTSKPGEETETTEKDKYADSSDQTDKDGETTENPPIDIKEKEMHAIAEEISLRALNDKEWANKTGTHTELKEYYHDGTSLSHVSDDPISGLCHTGEFSLEQPCDSTKTALSQNPPTTQRLSVGLLTVRSSRVTSSRSGALLTNNEAHFVQHTLQNFFDLVWIKVRRTLWHPMNLLFNFMVTGGPPKPGFQMYHKHFDAIVAIMIGIMRVINCSIMDSMDISSDFDFFEKVVLFLTPVGEMNAQLRMGILTDMSHAETGFIFVSLFMKQ